MDLFIKISCCFNSYITTCLEIFIIILSFIGIVLSIIGFIVIPWGYTSKITETFYIISFILFTYSLIVSLILLIYHIKKKLDTLLDCCLLTSFFEIISCIISIILNIFIAIETIMDFKNKKEIEEVIESNGNIMINEHRLVSNNKIILDTTIILINILIWIILLFLWMSESIRIKYNIYGSYNDYKINMKKIEMKNPRKFGFTLVGHDKYGSPIYAKKERGKNQLTTSHSNYIFKSIEKYKNSEMETNGIFRGSNHDKDNPNNYRNRSYKSVDVVQKYKAEKMEKYGEKYSGVDICNPYYSNFENKTELNRSSLNNSINPGY